MKMMATERPKFWIRASLHRHWAKILGILAVLAAQMAFASAFSPNSFSHGRLNALGKLVL